MSPEDAAIELYRSAPPDFVAARNALAARIAAHGDRRTAAQVRRFPRPSAGAWAVNSLVRDEPAGFEKLAGLGDRYRAAEQKLDRAALVELGRERKKLLGDLLARSRASAEAAGHPLSSATIEEVEQTLRAVVADAGAASAVGSGRLIAGLRADGIEAVDLDGVIAGGESASPRRRRATKNSTPIDPDAARREAAREANDALAAWKHADARRGELVDRAQRLDRAAKDAESRRARLEGELERAVESRDAARSAAAQAQEALGSAVDAARAAKRASDAAQRRAERLESG